MAVDEFAPQPAVKSKIPLKICISGPGGSGKTMSALALAYNLLRAAGHPDELIAKKLYVVDTENGSASLYSDKYPFQQILFSKPYTPERNIKALERAVAEGAMFIILDSGSHEWAGPGGCMSIVDAAKGQGNDYTAWGKVTPRHDAFVSWIADCPVDMVVCLRAKVQYVLVTNNKGKQQPQKVGLEPIQRPGFDYEFSVAFMIDETHKCKADKDRTSIFVADDYDLRTPEVALAIHEWRASGAAYTPRPIFPREEAADKAKPKDPPPPATRKAAPSDLVTEAQAAEIWKAAKEHGKTEVDVKRYLHTHLGIDSLKKIPASKGQEVYDWAVAPLQPKAMGPGEAEARKIAAMVGASEADLSYEFALAKGDWFKVKAALHANAELADIEEGAA